MSNSTKKFATRLQRAGAGDRRHPLDVLVALKTYAQRHGVRSGGTWTPASRVIDALNVAFHRSFDNVTPMGKRVLTALDVSSSMAQPVHGMPVLSCREVGAAMALVTAKTEPEHRLLELPNGGLECAVPMVEALEQRWSVDVFLIYASGDVWCEPEEVGRVLREYREQVGIPAKLVVVGLASKGFTIADPDDSGMIDVAGFAPTSPSVINKFVTGSST